MFQKFWNILSFIWLCSPKDSSVIKTRKINVFQLRDLEDELVNVESDLQRKGVELDELQILYESEQVGIFSEFAKFQYF